MYKAIVMPHLEYCSIVWHPHTVCLQDCLQSLEKFALQICLKQWNVSYSELLSRAGIVSLQSHQIVAMIMFVYKVIYKLSFMSNDVFRPNLGRPSKLLNHSIPLLSYSGSTFRFIHSAIPYIVILWNALPFDPTVHMSLFLTLN